MISRSEHSTSCFNDRTDECSTSRVVKHTFQLTVLDNSAEKTASLVVNTCIVLSYPINLFVYCGMSRKFRLTFAELFCRSASGVQAAQQQTIDLEDLQAPVCTAANCVRSRQSRHSASAV